MLAVVVSRGWDLMGCMLDTAVGTFVEGFWSLDHALTLERYPSRKQRASTIIDPEQKIIVRACLSVCNYTSYASKAPSERLFIAKATCPADVQLLLPTTLSAAAVVCYINIIYIIAAAAAAYYTAAATSCFELLHSSCELYNPPPIDTFGYEKNHLYFSSFPFHRSTQYRPPCD